jgi:WD40 repeat protein
VSTATLDGHSQNVDLCGWHPTKAILFTAGTDRKVFLWDLRQSLSQPKAIELELLISDAASAFDWSHDGKKIAIGIINSIKLLIYVLI